MKAFTRQPRLLVKMTAGSAKAASFKMADKKPEINLNVEPLFKSIEPPSAKLAAAAAPRWHVVEAKDAGEEVNAWDMAHAMVAGGQGFGVAGGPAEFAEPDLEQQWIVGTDRQQAFAMTRSCESADPPNKDLPQGQGPYWFRDGDHSQLENARNQIGNPQERIRIAHLDTGYDPDHVTLPQFLRKDLQKNFVDPKRPDDAADRSSGLVNNFGHGTGTLSILAGNAYEGVALGGAAFLDIVPVRVADAVVLFKNSSIARAFDYVHDLWQDPNTRVHVITMSMGGLASAAWADAVNALYDLGVFIVTAAGNNFGNLPTRNIVYPARFKRVVAACGVMADDKPYADLPLRTMAGNYGPDSKMDTALAAYTPNTPWARLGCSKIVDRDGRGTSAATPQVASTAALWIQKNIQELNKYPEGWMRVEATRKALFDAARLPMSGARKYFGRGVIQAEASLAQAPAKADALKSKKQPKDTASFPFLRVITGLGVAGDGAQPNARQRMIELEALQLTQQSHELEQLLPDPEIDPNSVPREVKLRFLDALASTPGASNRLRDAIGRKASTEKPSVAVPSAVRSVDAAIVKRAMDPLMPTPDRRKLRVFAFDPSLGTKLDTIDLNESTLDVAWEDDLQPGPVGEYLEVVDVDSASDVCYAPIDLNHTYPLSQAGLPPSETRPQFHQQMVYAVAMKTIERFEYALGRRALWSPRLIKIGDKFEEHYVRRLRIYPHAMCEANSYYSPDKKALLLGYFAASAERAGDNLPGQTIFCSLSHDVIAHETTHALLDGLHRRFGEATNTDVLAFHEAFADIVALFQHFSMPEALRNQIAKTQGDLAKQNMLGQLAQQFGQGIGHFGALRDAIGEINDKGEWQPHKPSVSDYASVTEPHALGAILVAAVFDAFLNIYTRRTRDLVRLATDGTGVLPEGDISHDLVNRLAEEASKTATHVLNICIRALDYCPPVDITFGEYLRALVTADRDLVKNDPYGYRVAFIEAFRRRGIFPKSTRNLSIESVCWDSPDIDVPVEEVLKNMNLRWDMRGDRRGAFYQSRKNRLIFHEWAKNKLTETQALELGFYNIHPCPMDIGTEKGELSPFEVHSVRPVRRVGPDGQQQTDLVVEITQSWTSKKGDFYRGGSTLIIGLEDGRIRYCIRKRVAQSDRVESERGFRMSASDASVRSNYFSDIGSDREPFAMLHRGA